MIIYLEEGIPLLKTQPILPLSHQSPFAHNELHDVG